MVCIFHSLDWGSHYCVVWLLFLQSRRWAAGGFNLLVFRFGWRRYCTTSYIRWPGSRVLDRYKIASRKTYIFPGVPIGMPTYPWPQYEKFVAEVFAVLLQNIRFSYTLHVGTPPTNRKTYILHNYVQIRLRSPFTGIKR